MTAISPAAVPPERDGRRWLILFVGLIAMTAGCTFQYGIAYLIPALRQEGFSLELASVLVACPTIGLLLTLIAWGAAADRWGERVVLSAGLGLAGLILLVAAGGARGDRAGCRPGPGRRRGRVGVRGQRPAHPGLVRPQRARPGHGHPAGRAAARRRRRRRHPAHAGRRRPVRAAAVPGRVLPGRGGGRDPGRARPAPARPRRGRASRGPPRPTGSRCCGGSTRPAPCWSCSQFTVATFALVFLVDAAALGRRHRGPRAGHRPGLRRRRPARAPATGPTGPAAGCARCASWPSPPGSRCWPWPAPQCCVRPSRW